MEKNVDSYIHSQIRSNVRRIGMQRNCPLTESKLTNSVFND